MRYITTLFSCLLYDVQSPDCQPLPLYAYCSHCKLTLHHLLVARTTVTLISSGELQNIFSYVTTGPGPSISTSLVHMRLWFLEKKEKTWNHKVPQSSKILSIRSVICSLVKAVQSLLESASNAWD